MSTEELADPRLVASDDLVRELASLISDVLLDARDQTAERLELEYGDAPISGVSGFDGIARNAINIAVSDGNIRRESRPTFEDAIQRTFDRLNSDVHSPHIEETFGVRDRERARVFARNVEFSTRNASEDMLDRMRTGVRHGAMRGEDIDTILARVRDEFDRNELRNRSQLIARMEIQTAIQSTKLGAYDRSPDVDGIQIINPCSHKTTPLCRQLAGCNSGDNTVAWFDSGDIADQVSGDVGDDLLFEGFDPLPMIPPYHFGCRSEIAPAVRE